MTKEENKAIKPEAYQKPKCMFCGRELELRFGGCFDCAELQSILIDGEDMEGKDYTDWNKSQILAHIIRKAMKY